MNVLSVNVGKPRLVTIGQHPTKTGIYKEPVAGKIAMQGYNLVGDEQADLVAHGGEFKAVYAYPHEHYAYWAAELNRNDFSYGQFGENLTTQGMDEDTVCVGDVFRIGTALLQVTQPRVPCSKLGHKMGFMGFVKQFHISRRTGFYFRIVEAGQIEAGDSIEKVSADPQGITVKQVFDLMYYDDDPTLAKRALKIDGLAPGWLAEFEAMAQ